MIILANSLMSLFMMFLMEISFLKLALKYSILILLVDE